MIHLLKNKKAIPVCILMSIVLVCCKGTQYLIPTNLDVAVAQVHYPGTTLAQLTRGYDIFSDKCTDCHGIKKPQKWSETDWIKTMRIMGHKAKLDSGEYNLVQHYILTKRETILAPGKK